MNKSKTIGCVIWFLLFALSVFLLFIIPKEYTAVVWIALVFDIIAYVSQFALWFFSDKDSDKKNSTFNRYPGMVVAAFYLIIQSLLCIVTACTVTVMSIKLSITLNLVIMIIMWVLILMLKLSKKYIERVDSRQKDHHVVL